MNYLAALLGLALMGAVTTAAIYRGDAANYKSQLVNLKASYSTAAQQAKDDATRQEQADLKNLQSQSSQAIQQATYAKNQAQLAAATYQGKLAQLAGKPNLDLPHACANQPIPSELIP